MSKDIKLTNWQVPRDPQMAGLDALTNAANANPIDMDKYENVGSVEHHETVDSVVEKMIYKQEISRGQKIDKVAVESKVNLGGVKDTRSNRTFWKP